MSEQLSREETDQALDWACRTDLDALQHLWIQKNGRKLGPLSEVTDWLCAEHGMSHSEAQDTELYEAAQLLRRELGITPRAFVQQVGSGGCSFSVFGIKQPPLTEKQSNVIKKLIEAGPNGISKSELESLAGDARKTLKRIHESTSEWGEAILLPGKPGRRYRILHQ